MTEILHSFQRDKVARGFETNYKIMIFKNIETISSRKKSYAINHKRMMVISATQKNSSIDFENS